LDTARHEAISTHSLSLDTPFGTGKIISAGSSLMKNEHASLHVNILLDKKPEIRSAIEGVSITLAANGHHLFSGRIKQAELRCISDKHTVSLQILSGSCLMDEEKRRRSYQDVNMPFDSIFHNVFQKANGAYIAPKIDISQRTGRMFIQYDETDWDLIIRLASHLGVACYPSLQSADAWVSIGLPNSNKRLKLDLSKDSYRILKTNQDIQYEVITDQHLGIGDVIIIDNNELIVLQQHWITYDQLIRFTYLCSPFVEREKKKYNSAIKGAMLSGEVLSRNQEYMKLALDIDSRIQDEATAHPLPFLPETAAIMYALPEIGETVNLRILEDDEEDSHIVDCPRPRNERKRAYEIKRREMITKERNIVTLDHEGELIISEDMYSPAYSLHMHEGIIEITATAGLYMKALKKISIRAKNNAGVYSSSSLELVNRGTGKFMAMSNNLYIFSDHIIPTETKPDPQPERKNTPNLEMERISTKNNAINALTQQCILPMLGSLSSIGTIISPSVFALAAIGRAMQPRSKNGIVGHVRKITDGTKTKTAKTKYIATK